MQFSPKSEKEIRSALVWPAGEYAFDILERAMLGGRETATCETRSESGKDMIQLVVRVTNGDQTRVVIDYLMPDIAGKLRHACDACGLMARYQAGELHAGDFIGRAGRLRLRIERARGGYTDRNIVADYVPGSNAAA
jgi:hypothetical protein